MLENVNMVEACALTDGNADDDIAIISKKELNRLKREREEYRAMCLEFAESIPKFHKIQDNIDAILAKGGVLE